MHEFEKEILVRVFVASVVTDSTTLRQIIGKYDFRQYPQ